MLASSLSTASPAAAQGCVGDCDASGDVTVDEILKAVSIALGAASSSGCNSADSNRDGTVTVDEILNAVTAALRGCSTGAGVCGVAVSSVPRICGLEVLPNPVIESGELVLRVSVVDLEGDVVQLCLGYAESGQTPGLECEPIEPSTSTINGAFNFGPFSAPPVGSYTGVIRFIDAAGNRSNDLSTGFAVVPDQSPAELFLYGGADLSTFLGCLTCPETATDSVFNRFGPYGSSFSPTSIWNRFGDFGSDFSSTSVCNRFASDPPGVFDSRDAYFGRLTRNNFHPQALRAQEFLDFVNLVCSSGQ